MKNHESNWSFQNAMFSAKTRHAKTSKTIRSFSFKNACFATIEPKIIHFRCAHLYKRTAKITTTNIPKKSKSLDISHSKVHFLTHPNRNRNNFVTTDPVNPAIESLRSNAFARSATYHFHREVYRRIPVGHWSFQPSDWNFFTKHSLRSSTVAPSAAQYFDQDVYRLKLISFPEISGPNNSGWSQIFSTNN